MHVFRESTKRLNHPLVGELELDQETMPPKTAAEDGLKLLASWSATTGQEQDAQSTSNPPPRQA
ncbi:hypothetical protein [Streptomyces sp. NPDC051636]|uniref:hypothetical protein n=1 Tax=Streptomyces sp. NPDC051636 TaxID=3365663 RepID=UPI0037AF44D1